MLRFNQTCRTEVMDKYFLQELSEVRGITDIGNRHYNAEQPCELLADMTISEY